MKAARVRIDHHILLKLLGLNTSKWAILRAQVNEYHYGRTHIELTLMSDELPDIFHINEGDVIQQGDIVVHIVDDNGNRISIAEVIPYGRSWQS